MVQQLLIARTVNLWKLKDYVGLILGNVAVLSGSHYRRLTRFFDKQSQQPEFQLDIQRQVFKVLRRLNYTYLLLDGSSWKRGEQKCHYMVLSVLAGSVAIPIYWKQLEKIGSSSQVERKELFEEAMQYFDLSKMTLLKALASWAPLATYTPCPTWGVSLPLCSLREQACYAV